MFRQQGVRGMEYCLPIRIMAVFSQIVDIAHIG